MKTIDFSVGLVRRFTARHRLAGCGPPESELHAHDYELEIEVQSDRISSLGFVIDITRLAPPLDAIINRLHGSVLNDLEELHGLNPTMEAVAKLVGDELARALEGLGLSAVVARVWEDPRAWASYRVEL